MWTTHNHMHLSVTMIKLIYLANSCPPIPPPPHTHCATERKQHLEIICFHANCKDVGVIQSVGGTKETILAEHQNLCCTYTANEHTPRASQHHSYAASKLGPNCAPLK